MVKKFYFLFGLCVLLVAVHILNVATSFSLNQHGIWPRHAHYLWGIFTAPFLHGSLYHLVNNLIGLCLFSSFYFVHSLRRYIYSSLIIIVITGGLVWLFGRNAMHIGASGWIFGLWGLCIATAWYERKLINILIACIVIIFYGGVIYGVLPRDPSVSFESHLFGVLAGVICASLNAKFRIK